MLLVRPKRVKWCERNSYTQVETRDIKGWKTEFPVSHFTLFSTLKEAFNLNKLPPQHDYAAVRHLTQRQGDLCIYGPRTGQ